MVEKSGVVQECSSCGRLKQEIEIARKDQAATLKMIKEKIMSTDKLIKKYQRKCDDFDKQTKLFNDVTSKYENCERNIEILQEQLNHSLEVIEPQKKSITRLIQEKFIAEGKIEELKQNNTYLEEVINQLKDTIQRKDDKDSSWKHEQQLQAKDIEKEKKRNEKLTKELEKAKEDIKKGRGLVNEKNREIRSFGRKCSNLELQLKTLKEELKSAKAEANYGNCYQTKRKLSPKERNRPRRVRQSEELCKQKVTKILNDSPVEDNVASNDEPPSVAAIFDEMTKLTLHPVLSPVPSSSTSTDDESKYSGSESSDEHFKNSSDSSSDDGDEVFGDLAAILEMKLGNQDAISGEGETTSGLNFDVEDHGYLENNVSCDEDVGAINVKLVHFANDDENHNVTEKTILEPGRKGNTLENNIEIENRTIKRGLFEKNVAEEGETPSGLDLLGSSKEDSVVIPSNVLVAVATPSSSILSEVNTCDSKTKNVCSVESGKETAREVDIQNNNLSSLKEDVIQKSGVVHMALSVEKVKSDGLVLDEVVKSDVNLMNIDKNGTLNKDGDESAVIVRRVDEMANPSRENPSTESKKELQDGKVTSTEITLNDLECVDTVIQNEFEVDSGKEDVNGDLRLPVSQLKKMTKAKDKDVLKTFSISRTKDKADDLPSKAKVMNDKCNKSRENLDNILLVKREYEVKPKIEIEPDKDVILLEKDLDNDTEGDMSCSEGNIEQCFFNVDPNVCMQESREKSSKPTQSQDLACKMSYESTLIRETVSSKRRIAHRPKKQGEISSNSSGFNNSSTKGPSQNESPKQNFKSIEEFGVQSNESHLSEHVETTSLEITQRPESVLNFNEEGFGVRKTPKSKRRPTGFCDIDSRKRQRRLGKNPLEKTMPKQTETTIENTQKQIDSTKFIAEISENDINENNVSTPALSGAKSALILSKNEDNANEKENPMRLQLDSNSNLSSDLFSKEEGNTARKSSIKNVFNKVPIYENSTKRTRKEDIELQCFDGIVDNTDTILDRGPENPLDEEQTSVMDDAIDTSGGVLEQIIFSPTKTINLSSDCDRTVGNSRTKEAIMSGFFLGVPEVPQDSTQIDVVPPIMENTEIGDKKSRVERGGPDQISCQEFETLTSDGTSDSIFIKVNEPVDDNDQNDTSSVRETVGRSDNVQSNISKDLPSISLIINDQGLFERMPPLSPLPSSPNSSCELSQTHENDFLDEPSQPPFTSLAIAPSASSNISSIMDSVGNRVSSLRSVTQPSCTAKGRRSSEECRELEMPGESDLPKQDAGDATVVSPNFVQVEELASNKQKKKKKCSLSLSVRPIFLSEVKYALKVLRFLAQEGIKMEDVIDRLSSPKNMSNGTPLAATLVKFPRNEDLLPIIIQRYNDRYRENFDQKARLTYLNHWKPVLSVFEERVLVMVTRLSTVEHFKGLSTKIISLLSRSVLHSCRGAEEPDKRCVASNCRLLCALCQKESNLQRMRVLCYDIIRSLHSKPGTVLYLMISIAAVWPTVLSSSVSTLTTTSGLVCMGGETYPPLPCTIQMVLTTWARSNDWVLLGNVMDWLCAWKQVPTGVLSMRQLAGELVRLMKDPSFAHLMSGKDGNPVLGFDLYEVVKALELVACVLGWAWLNNVLIKEFIWEILTTWVTSTHPVMSNASSARPAVDSSLSTPTTPFSERKQDMDGIQHIVCTSSSPLLPNTVENSKQCCEATVVASIRLLGLVCGITIQQYQASIPQVMHLLISLLERSQDFKVSYAVQLACSYTLLDISPWQPRKVASVLEKWKVIQDKTSLPEALVQGLNALNLCLKSNREYSLPSKGNVHFADKEQEDIENDLNGS